MVRSQVLACDPSSWYSKIVRYQKPHVDRLYLQRDSLRICLHRIHSCDEEEAFVHPHPWPSVSWILRGGYEMGLFEGELFGPLEKVKKPSLCTSHYGEGSSWEMKKRAVSHYVCPRTETYSVMLMGEPWRNAAVNPFHYQVDPVMDDEEKASLLGIFKGLV